MKNVSKVTLTQEQVIELVMLALKQENSPLVIALVNDVLTSASKGWDEQQEKLVEREEVISEMLRLHYSADELENISIYDYTTEERDIINRALKIVK